MVRLQGSLDVGRPPDIVFDTVADERNVYDPSVLHADKLTKGPLGVGTRFWSVVRGWRAPVETIVTITGFDRPRRLHTMTSAAGVDIASEMTFSAQGRGTRILWRCDLRPRGVLRLLGPLLGPVAKRQTTSVWEALRNTLERSPFEGAEPS